MDSGGYVVGWGTLSLLNAGLAQAKGRTGLGWWIVSLLLGPIATFLIVVLPDRHRRGHGYAEPVHDGSWIGRPLTSGEALD